MSDLKRYRPEVGAMKCNMAGQFVKFTDYAELRAQVKELEDTLKYIASNPYALDDISYCQCAGEALAERNEL